MGAEPHFVTPQGGRLLTLVVLLSCGGINPASASVAASASSGPWALQDVPSGDPPPPTQPGTPVPTPGPDTIPAADTLPSPELIEEIPPGLILPDTLLPEELQSDRAAEALLAADEMTEIRNLPQVPTHVPDRWGTGVWEWDREGLLGTRAITLVELVEQLPGVLSLRGGDYGQPTAVTSAGLDPGRIRVFLDGVELPPLDGGVVDLSRIGLAGLDRVRVERRPSELRIELTPLQIADPRPYSLLEVGTGDLNTNLFRGTFAHPSALGGTIVVALDRVDTQGTGRIEPGASFGGQLRYSLFQGERGGMAFDFRRMTSRRPTEVWLPRDVARTDWGLRARYELAPGLIAGGYVHRSSLGLEDGEVDPGAQVNLDPRSQAGLRVAYEGGAIWAEGELRRSWGEGWPAWKQALQGGANVPGIGGVSAAIEREGWEDEGALALHTRAWTEPRFGFSVYGELDDGRRGVPFRVLPGMDGEGRGASPSFTERRGTRIGLEFERGRLFAAAARLSVSADSLHPLGIDVDREGIVSDGGERAGLELSGRIPFDLLLPGLGVEGMVQLWERSDDWRYHPSESYEARLRYHDIFFDTENLEVWFDVGVRGRERMRLPFEDTAAAGTLVQVPSLQNWFGRLQIRVVSVRVFLLWDNFTLRDTNQDFPGRLLPHTRAMYGVRWTLWN